MNEQSICVFCGSRSGVNPSYHSAARRVGLALGKRGIGLVYGGGRVGLMGIVADAALEAGGHVLGVIPEAMSQKEIAHHGVSELIIVPGMHERKALMARRSSAFLALPGGVGTFEELFEVWTWGVLGIHQKPIGLLNVEGYFGPLLAMIDHAVAEGFVPASHSSLIRVGEEPEPLIEDLMTFRPVLNEPRTIEIDQT